MPRLLAILVCGASLATASCGSSGAELPCSQDADCPLGQICAAGICSAGQAAGTGRASGSEPGGPGGSGASTSGPGRGSSTGHGTSGGSTSAASSSGGATTGGATSGGSTTGRATTGGSGTGVATTSGGSSGGTTGACAGETWGNFAQSFFQQSCVSCHWDFGLYLVVFFDSSSISSKIQDGSMPLGGTLTATQKQDILTWLGCGMPQ